MMQKRSTDSELSPVAPNMPTLFGDVLSDFELVQIYNAFLRVRTRREDRL